jgi:hypothetical protein
MGRSLSRHPRLHYTGVVTRGVLAVAFTVLAVLAAGCRGSSDRAALPAPTTTTKTVCKTPATARATARLQQDVAAIRRAARLPTRDSLKGNAAVNAATDRFLLDVARAPVTQLAKNRFIDHAAGALVGSCEQCFQALEANRPIPAIAHSGACN